MDERRQLAIWKDVMELLEKAANLVLQLPDDEVDSLLADLEGSSMGWTDEDTVRGPVFDRVLGHVVALERRVLASGRPGTN